MSVGSKRISTDYLVVGAGATGLAFADSLATESDAEIVLVDRRETPGGHWVDAYPFVVLHTPSAFYGVNSLTLGANRIDQDGPNAGLYERAGKDEILAYYAEVVSRLEGTGRVRTLLGYDHRATDGPVQQLRAISTGRVVEVDVRRRVVDARYQEASIPATHVPSFEVADDARFVPVGQLPDAAGGSATRYAVLGAGKTAVDACLWLLDNSVDPERIIWVRPRDAWFHERSQFQPLDLVVPTVAGFATDTEAAAQASGVEDLFDRLEDAGRMHRIDAAHPATMYRGGMLSSHELDHLRRIRGVVRLGRVRRIEAGRTLLDHDELPTGPDVVNVDCSAHGLRDAPATPVFAPGRIVLQQVRYNSPTFNAALIAFVEAHRHDDETKNRLCAPHPYSASVTDYPRMLAHTWRTEGSWLGESDLSGWVSASRLNLTSALAEHRHEPAAVDAITRYVTHIGPAIDRLESLPHAPA